MAKPTANPDPAEALRAVIFDAETAMLAVYDFALILHDYLSDDGDLDSERRGALCHLTCSLLGHGRELKQLHAAMFAAVTAEIPRPA